MAFWNRKPRAAAKLRELEPHPDLATGRGEELLRAWTVRQRLHVVAPAGALAPGAWGVVLADLLRHVARAWSQARDMPPAAFEEDLHAAFRQHSTGEAGVGDDAWLTVVSPGRGALPHPSAAARDPDSSEVLRLVRSEVSSFAIRWEVFGVPEPWGYLAADLACYLARAAARGGADEAEYLAEIHRVFEAEWQAPTTELTGEIDDPRRAGGDGATGTAG